MMNDNKNAEIETVTKPTTSIVPKDKTEKTEKKVILNDSITFNLERIKKNIDFCNDAGTPEALLKGGKYFASFSKLVTDTIAMELEELKKRLIQYFPYLPNTKEGKRLAKVIDETIENSSKYFEQPTRNADNKALINAFDKVSQDYSNKYVDIVLSGYERKMNA